MIQFATPTFFLLLLFVPLLVWWWLRQRPNALRYPATALLAHLPTGRAHFARIGGAVLRGLTLTLIIIALTGPRFPDLRTRIKTEGIAIVMLVDVSGSMAEHDFDWNGEPLSRLDAVKRVFRLFVEGGHATAQTADGSDAKAFEGRPTDLIGLVTFATRPETIRPLTLSHTPLLHTLDEEQPRHIPGESETNLSDALTVALERLRSAKPEQRKVLVLLTDGEHNVAQPRSTWTPRQAAQIATSLQIPLYTIDAGNDTAGPEIRAAAVQTLQDLAHITNGRYYQARDTNGLLAACQSIDELERLPIESFQYERYYEAHWWFGLAAFVVLSLTFLLERTVWRKLP
jgi:Ca-activated chloride channel family protein